MQSDVDLEGGKIHISGSLHQVNNTMYINGGKLEVYKDYYIEADGDNGKKKPSYGMIKMTSNTDRVEVGGDFWARSYNSSTLSAGEMTFGGNVTDYNGNTFRCSGTHKVGFNNKNDIVVELQNGAYFQTLASSNRKIHYKKLSVKSLANVTHVEGDVDELCTKIDLNGQDLLVHGSINKVSADIDLNGGRLIIDENFTQTGSSVIFNKGRMEVWGDYNIESSEKDGDGTPKAGYAMIKMDDPKDTLIVGGNLTARIYNSSTLTEGSISVGGEINDVNGNTTNRAKGNITVNGSEKAKASDQIAKIKSDLEKNTDYGSNTETKPEELKPDGKSSEESKPEETKPEETKPNEPEANDTKNGGDKPDIEKPYVPTKSGSGRGFEERSIIWNGSSGEGETEVENTKIRELTEEEKKEQEKEIAEETEKKLDLQSERTGTQKVVTLWQLYFYANFSFVLNVVNEKLL